MVLEHGTRARLSFSSMAINVEIVPIVHNSSSSFSSSEKTESQVVEELNNNPYYLASNENSGAVLVSQPLVDVENYPSWSWSIIIALTVKSKIGFIDGTIPIPDPSSPLFNAWIHCHTTVLSCLFSSLGKNIHSSVMYSKTFRQVWLNLKYRFDQGNADRFD